MLRRSVTLGIGLGVLLWILKYAEALHLTEELSLNTYLGLVGTVFLVVGVAAGFLLKHGNVNEPATRAIGPNSGTGTSDGATAVISKRERQVLSLLEQGYSNRDISKALEISLNTTKSHVARIFEKLGAARRTEAVRRARDLQLLS